MLEEKNILIRKGANKNGEWMVKYRVVLLMLHQYNNNNNNCYEIRG